MDKAADNSPLGYGDLGAHDYDDSQWGYKGSDGHAHCCKTDGCTAYNMPVAHIPGPEATETTPQTCTACGYVIKEALGHLCANHLIFVPAKAATCTEEGNIEYYRCSDDGKLYTDMTAAVATSLAEVTKPVVPHSYGEWQTRTAAACTAKGVEFRKCASCTAEETRDTEMLPHDYADATCTAPKTCKNCPATTGEVLGHDMQTTWSTDGTHHWHDCTRCDHTTEYAEHTPGAEATEEAAQACTVCGYELAEKLTHAPMLVEGYEATTTAPGKADYYHCDSCGKNYADVTSIHEITGDVEAWRVIPMIITIIEGANGEWTKGESEGLIFKSNADFADFTGVFVDGAEVAAENYTAISGSTVVTLKQAYLETLSVGEHTLVIKSGNDQAETRFSIKAKPGEPTKPTSPQTGDSSNLVLWIAILFVSLGGVTTTVVCKKRKAKEE